MNIRSLLLGVIEMNGNGHQLTTLEAVKVLGEMGILAADVVLYSRPYLAASAVAADHKMDVELINVEYGMDDPHNDQEAWTTEDIPHYYYGDKNFTAFNHFIDIKKGPGIFDDFDGYAYNNGSASKDEYQDASDVTSGFTAFLADVAGFKVDEGINWWFNDEYVHAPGHQWYKNCSPSLEHYSFPQDKGKYPTVLEELAHRFIQEKRKGVPYSTFMPVDNMARYWYNYYLKKSNDVEALGFVMHAIQDATIPHHAAGYMGNWHQEYENEFDRKIGNWLQQPAFKNEVKGLIQKWLNKDPNPPKSLLLSDRNRIPAINWPIEMLVTWLALNAYQEYAVTYNNFQNGFQVNENSMRNLAKNALSMSALVLVKAREESKPDSPVDIATRWLHIRDHVSSVILGPESIEAKNLLFITDSISEDIFIYNNQPNAWTRIGEPGKKFVVAGSGTLYGLSPDGKSIWKYLGKPDNWTKVGGAAEDIFGGEAGLFAIEPGSHAILRYQENGTWLKVGGPGKMFAVGSRLYGLAPDGSSIWQYQDKPDSWKKIGGAAKAIYSVGDRVYAELLPSGNFSMFVPETANWVTIGGPGEMFGVGSGENIVGLSPGGNGIYKYQGFPMKWRRIADKAVSVFGAQNYSLALAESTGLHLKNDHSLYYLDSA